MWILKDRKNRMPVSSFPYRVGLALSGGGAKGFAHVGALQALEETGLRPDIIAGTSAGALAGALYADGYSPQDILALFSNKSFLRFARFTVPHTGIFNSEPFQYFLHRHLRARTFEELKIPLVVVATDIENGAETRFSSGDLMAPVVASCTFPLVFVPKEIDGKHYLDGGLSHNFPASILRPSAETVIGVNVASVKEEPYRNSLLYVAERTYHFMSNANTHHDRQMCDILIEPAQLHKYATFDLDHIEEIFEIGYSTSTRILQEKRDILKRTNII